LRFLSKLPVDQVLPWAVHGNMARLGILTGSIPKAERHPCDSNALFADKMNNGWMFELCLALRCVVRGGYCPVPNIKPGEKFMGYAKGFPKTA